MFVIPALGRLEQEGHKTSLDTVSAGDQTKRFDIVSRSTSV